MQRMTIARLEKIISNLRSDIETVTGKKVSFCLEHGGLATNWKVTFCPRGSRTVLYGRTKQELADKVFAASDVLRSLQYVD